MVGARSIDDWPYSLQLLGNALKKQVRNELLQTPVALQLFSSQKIAVIFQ